MVVLEIKFDDRAVIKWITVFKIFICGGILSDIRWKSSFTMARVRSCKM